MVWISFNFFVRGGKSANQQSCTFTQNVIVEWLSIFFSWERPLNCKLGLHEEGGPQWVLTRCNPLHIAGWNFQTTPTVPGKRSFNVLKTPLKICEIN